MESSSNKKENFVTRDLFITKFYTFQGIKTRYRLSDMAYGEWLIYRNNNPVYHFNMFDKSYSSIKNKLKGNITDFLTKQLKKTNSDLTVRPPKIIGVSGKDILNKLVVLEKLPKSLLE